MFDNIRINPDLLPVSADEKFLLKEVCAGGFQTKSLQRLLRIIEITNDKKLRWQDTNWKEVSKNDLTYPKAPEKNIYSQSGLPKQNNYPNYQWVYEVNFTGEIRFYESVNDMWYEFCALFAHGELLKIVKMSPE